MFERHLTLSSSQIINYLSDAEGKFLLLLGIISKVILTVILLYFFFITG